MITSQIIQNSIDELKTITKVDLGVYDLNGAVVASTMEKCDITNDLVSGFVNSPADSQVIGAHHLLKILVSMGAFGDFVITLPSSYHSLKVVYYPCSLRTLFYVAHPVLDRITGGVKTLFVKPVYYCCLFT